MARVVCSLPNASTSINGITFTADREGMISDEIDDGTAATLATIPGFVLADKRGRKRAGDAPTGDAEMAPVTTADPATPATPAAPAAQ